MFLKNISPKKIITSLCVASYAVMSAAYAEELITGDLPGTIEGSVTVTSEYAFRGIQQSNEKPALQAGLTWSHDSGLYVGFWGSTVDYNDGDDSTNEMDLFIGYTKTIDKLTLDVSFIQYFYPGATSSLNYDFSEIMLGASYDFDIISLGASVNYSPDYWGGSGEAFYTAANFSIPVRYGITIDGGVGYQTIESPLLYGIGNDYMDWNLGVSVPLKDFTLGFQYTDTNLSRTECSDGCEERFISSLSYNF